MCEEWQHRLLCSRVATACHLPERAQTGAENSKVVLLDDIEKRAQDLS